MRSESVRFVRKWEGNYHYGYTDADAFTNYRRRGHSAEKKLLQVQECDGWRRCPELNTGIRGLQAPRLSAWLHRHR